MEKKYTLELLKSNWQTGLMLNPFPYICEHGENAVPYVAEALLESTTGYKKLGSPSFIRAEKLLLQSILYYLYKKAPPEEMNLPMLLTLVCSAYTNYADGESDLLLLFKDLRENNQAHIALKHYDEYMETAGKTTNLAAQSVRQRFRIFFPTGDIWIFENINDAAADIPNLARSLIHNLKLYMNNYITSLDTAESFLFAAVLFYSYYYTKKKEQKIQNIMGLLKFSELFENIMRLKPDDLAYINYMQGQKLKTKETAEYFTKLYKMLNFFIEFEETDSSNG